MTKDRSGKAAKPSAKNARLERQARELRDNLLRRKEQSRARSARRLELSEPPVDDGNKN